jgi:eukaryotic-like serine/threonine-protein kinase
MIRGEQEVIRALGRYEIIGHLATGGMADVWLARSCGAGGFSKLVALKTLLPAYSSRAELVDMLVREASVAAKLIHPGIVQIFDLGLIDGQYFIAMEYVPGLTMRHVMSLAHRGETRVPLAPILHALAEVCDALHYAHGIGLIHRDISPENIMISELGHAKILDFGIVADRNAPVTQIGRVKGKYAYMPPEVFKNAPSHQSRDIWAIGVVFYELICGRRPFEADNEAQLIVQILQGDVLPPRAHDPTIPEEVEWTVMRCLQPKQTDRPSSANELASMLRILMHQQIARGEDEDIAALLKLGRVSAHARVFQEDDMHSVLSELAEIAVLEPSIDAAIPTDLDIEPHLIPAQDTGDLFPAVRALPRPGIFDIFSPYRSKK